MKYKFIITIVLVAYTITLQNTIKSHALTEYNPDILNSCTTLYCDNNEQGSFVYGFNANGISCVRVLPDFCSRQLAVKGKVRAMCQNGKYSYAIAHTDVIENNFLIYEFDSLNGNSKTYELLGENKIVPKHFSVSDKCIYLLKTDGLYAYVKRINLSDGKTKNYKFSNNNVTAIFNNNGNTYAVLYNGSIYKLTASGSAFCAEITNGNSKISNAGADYIFTSNGELVCLADGEKSYITGVQTNCTATSNNSTYYAIGSTTYLNSNAKSIKLDDTIKSVLAYGNKSAAVTTDNDIFVLTSSDYKQESEQNNNGNNSNYSNSPHTNYKINSNGIITAVDSGTTVSQFKKQFSGDCTVYDTNGSVVKSGKMKTGYQLIYGSNTYSVAVRGDVTGEGNIKSNDIAMIMEYFTNSRSLSSVKIAALDYNLDGIADNKDLVLISRYIE